MTERPKTGITFGVFDGLHEGHKHFLADAASRCEALTVVVAQDEAVRRIKGKLPKRTLAERMEALQAFNPALSVVPGDEKEGEWGILKRHAPDMVFLGYDQKALAAELKKLDIPTTVLSAHRPETFKSGLLDN